MFRQYALLMTLILLGIQLFCPSLFIVEFLTEDFSKQYFFSVTNHGVSPQHAYRQPENHDANGMNCCYRSGIWSSVLDPERV